MSVVIAAYGGQAGQTAPAASNAGAAGLVLPAARLVCGIVKRRMLAGGVVQLDGGLRLAAL